MKKLNNKGMSLIELIISFSLVCVAVIYFFETLFITNKIFRTTKEDTKRYVDVAYIFNIIDYYVHTSNLDLEGKNFNNQFVKPEATSLDDDAQDLTALYNVEQASTYLDSKLAAYASLDSNFKWIKYNDIDDHGNIIPTINISTVTDQGHMFAYRFKMNDKVYYYFFATEVKTD